MPIRLDHVVIHVSDWERSNAFYRDVLGAELIDRPEGGPTRHYRLGDQQLNVHGPGVEPHPVAATPVLPAEQSTQLITEPARQHLERHGVEIEEGPVARHGANDQGTSVYFRDPDGSLLELISYHR